MERNKCYTNHLESEVLLPPRKRLLAGFKKQNSDGNGSPSPPKPASSSNGSTASDVQTNLNNILASQMNNPNLTPKEIAEASKSAAIAAVKAARAARAAADEKAAIAAKAVAAAKSALDLVASFPDEAAYKDICVKKNHKLKKRVPVELLYTKENQRVDEELAYRLRRAVDSSPRVLRTCSGSEGNGHKHKKQKVLVAHENSRFPNGASTVLGETARSVLNERLVAVEANTNSSKADQKKPVCIEKGIQLELDNMEAESSRSREKPGEEMNSSAKKKGRGKLKKLSLSNCSSREQANPKEEEMNTKSSQSPLAEKELDNLNTDDNKHSFQPEASSKDGIISVMAATTWKCQDLKAPECVKQNKAVHS